MLFLSGDFHFSHTNIIKYCHRPFKDVHEMNNTIIKNTNDLVGLDDTLVNVGDWCFSRTDSIKDAKHFRDQIKCRNILFVTGNHDPRYHTGQARKEFAQIFTHCCDILHLKLDGYDLIDNKGRTHTRELVCSHYAMRVWDKSHHGSWHAWGHSHYSLPDDPNSLSTDVGVDAVAGRATGMTHTELTKNNAWDLLKPENYRPISIDEFAELMSKKSFKPIDHHV